MNGSRQTRFRGYRLAAELADELHAAVATWDAFERWSVGIQLVRATDSIGANIAEGFGRGAGADRRRMFLIARGSVTEAEYWIERSTARGLLHPARYDSTIAEVARLLNGLIRSERI
jgi:four helix bundle protein